MTDSGAVDQAPPAFRSLRIAPDANVFTERVWVDRLIKEVEADHVRLFWSPKTIEEVGRVRLWIWIKRALRSGGLPEGSSAWKALWARYSDEAHQWFARVSLVCQVIEDREPHEPAWTVSLPDPNDAWLWNAARRADADVVVTANLRDAPPVDAEGARLHERIGYVHPRALMVLLDVWREIRTSNEPPDDVAERVRSAAGQTGAGDVPVIVAQLRMVLARISEEHEPA